VIVVHKLALFALMHWVAARYHGSDVTVT